ncbi:MAG: class I SAM-dependent methyltransferase [Chloroflexia bacterium]
MIGTTSNEGKPPDTSGRDQTACAHPRARFKPQFTTSDYISGDKFVVGFCNNCRLTVTTPVPPGNELSRYYPQTYYGSGRRFPHIVEWLLDMLYDFRVGRIGAGREPGKVLDIGCGRGLLLNKLKEKGWDPQGTELSEEAASYARDRLNLPVTTETLEDAHFPDNEFDLVILWHVLEHLSDPQGTLREVARVLKPGGTLLVAVPNFGSLEARFSGPGWFHLDVPRHLTHFTFQSLSEALGGAGLEVDKASYISPEYDFFSFVQSAQNKIGLRHNLLYNLLRTRSAKVLDEEGNSSSAGMIQSLLAMATAIPLGCLSLLCTPLVAFLHRGATMTVYAVKRKV